MSGRVDRIDYNERDGRWAILDYKTSDKLKDPGKEHYAKNSGVWKDLQLPLYCLLTESFQMESFPELGYVNLGRDEASVKFSLVRAWNEDMILEAREEAARVVRAIRAGEFGEAGRLPAFDPITQALLGVGLTEASDGEEEDE